MMKTLVVEFNLRMIVTQSKMVNLTTEVQVKVIMRAKKIVVGVVMRRKTFDSKRN